MPRSLTSAVRLLLSGTALCLSTVTRAAEVTPVPAPPAEGDTSAAALAVAQPGPVFVAALPEDATLAGRAWRAAITCTGWTAPHHPQVRIERRTVGAFDGRAHLDGDGLHRIELSGAHPRRSLLHEIAHAWARRGPAALTEGRADLLADCMARTLTDPDLLDPDDGRDLAALPDLRRWSNPRTHSGSDLLDESRADGYLGSARLFRVIDAVVPARQLWPRDGQLRWRDLEGRLLGQGPKGAIVWDVLEGGVERQREALSDADRDGLPWLAEILLGTDPERWDSDGDGWWDGASRAPIGAVPLPPDGSVVCSGVAAGKAGARLQVRYRATRATTHPPVRVVAGDVWLVDDPARGVRIDPHEPVLLALEGGLTDATGGAWALAGGQDLVNAWNCRSTPRYTVWVADPAATVALETFARELDEHMHRAEGLLGPADKRLVVALGSDPMRVRADAIYLSSGLLDWASQTGRLDALAGLAVALHRTWSGPGGVRRWDTAEALTRALVDAPPETLFVAVDEEQTADRAREAERCAWAGVVAGRCTLSDP